MISPEGFLSLFGVACVVVVGGFLLASGYLVVVMVRNHRSPVIDWPGRVVGKRVSDSLADGHTTTSHYVTFEDGAGRRREFGVSGREFGLLMEGDVGAVRSRGTWFLGFSRQR